MIVTVNRKKFKAESRFLTREQINLAAGFDPYADTVITYNDSRHHVLLDEGAVVWVQDKVFIRVR